LIGGLIAGIIALAGGSSAWPQHGVDRRITEQVLVHDPDVEDKIAVIDVKGLILSNSGYDGADAATVGAQLRRAKEDPHVVGVILDLDTPGGEITASDELYQAIRRFRLSQKPVVACMRSVCASGGYYVAAAADYIVANQLTLTGSIGVVIPGLTYAELLKKIGVKSTPYASGSMKTMLSGSVERSPEEQALVDSYTQSLVDASFYKFASVIAEGRDTFASADEVLRMPFADGRIMLAEDCIEPGLIDEIGYFEDAIERARQMSLSMNANVVRYRRTFTFSDFVFFKLGGTKIRLETGLPEAFTHLTSRNLYYLMPALVE
jgi:protease-4